MKSLLASAIPLVLLACGGDAFSPLVDSDAAPDAASDAPSNAPDAALDAAQAIDAGPEATAPASWCAAHTNVLFCEDFDDVADMSALAAKWHGAVVGNGAMTMMIDPYAPSAPHALGATAGNNDLAMILHAPFPIANARLLAVEYDLRVDHQSVQLFDAAALVTLVLGANPDKDTTIYLYLGYAGGLTLGWTDAADAGRGFHYVSLSNATPPAGQWNGRWGFVVSLADGGIAVAHNGVVVGGTSMGLSAGLLHPSALTVEAGLSHDTGSTGTVAIQIDNLIVDAK